MNISVQTTFIDSMDELELSFCEKERTRSNTSLANISIPYMR